MPPLNGRFNYLVVLSEDSEKVGANIYVEATNGQNSSRASVWVKALRYLPDFICMIGEIAHNAASPGPGWGDDELRQTLREGTE